MGSLQVIAQVVDDSAQCNYSQLVTDPDGTTVVPVYDWTTFFIPHMRKISGIKKIHHFRFKASEPGVVYTKVHSDDKDWKKFDLRKSTSSWCPDPSEYPTRVIPKGLSQERQWYLHDSIREFCPEEYRDITCPVPSVPRPRSRAGTPVDDAMDEAVGEEAVDSHDKEDFTSPLAPPTKKSRHCGTCRREGHNSRSCPQNKH